MALAPWSVLISEHIWQGLLLGDMPALYPKKHTSSVLTTLGQWELLKADCLPSVYPHCLAQPECSEIERRNKLVVLSHKVGALVNLTFAGKQTQNKVRNTVKNYFVDFAKAFDNISELRLQLWQLFYRFVCPKKFSNSLRLLCDRFVLSCQNCRQY